MEKIMLVPTGAEQFSCIGADCEAHCCNTWNIDIDKVGFMKVTTSSNSTLKPIAKKAYARNTDSKSNGDYGRMKLDKDKQCYFLDENKWCLVHKELGEKALCNTCAIYPREHREIGDYIEKSLTLSCPETVRVLLLQQEGLSFEEVMPQSNERIVSKAILQGEAVDSMWQVRMFAISLLQERGITLDLRLMLLGVFVEQLMLKDLTPDNVRQAVEAMQLRLSNGDYLNAMNELKGNELVQLTLNKELLRTTVEELSHSVRYVKVVNQFILGLQTGPLEQETISETTLFNYLQAQRIYNAFTREHGYILENYMVHYIFTQVFPYNAKTPLAAYEDIVLNSQLIKALLVGIAADKGEITVADAVLVIQSYTRDVHHNAKSYSVLRQKIEASQMDTLAYLFAYIKTNE